MLNKKTLDFIKQKYEHYSQKTKFGLIALICIGFLLFVFLYYVVLGLGFNSTIRKNTDIEQTPVAGLNTIGVASFVIDTEVQDNLWTPSLPFFFPTYFLDNLPNFQLGEMSATANIIKAISNLAKADKKLKKAAKLLSYDGRVWMFDKTGLLPVPSSASQYKKGRQLLIKSNPLDNGLLLDKTSLLYLFNKMNKDLEISLIDLDKSIIEDIKADDAFYYNQGKMYAYATMLKALSVDFKNILVEKDLYADLTSVIKALSDGVEISPFIIKNSNSSSGSANHLYNLSYYIQKALLKLNLIQQGLQL